MTQARFPYRDPEPERGGLNSNGDGITPWLEQRLFDRHVVMLVGQLTSTVASNVAAALLTLDALSTETIQLHVASPEGDLAAAFAIVDAIDAMRAPVHAVVPSMAGGAALLVLAAADRRIAYRHARIRLTEPHATAASGTADQVAAAAGEYLRELEELIVRMAEVTGQPRSRIETDLAAGRFLSAAEAQDYGLVNEIIGKPRGDAA